MAASVMDAVRGDAGVALGPNGSKLDRRSSALGPTTRADALSAFAAFSRPDVAAAASQTRSGLVGAVGAVGDAVLGRARAVGGDHRVRTSPSRAVAAVHVTSRWLD
jgi:hypothetical protein